MLDHKSTMLAIAQSYGTEAKRCGAPSLSRVATIVVNRGSFFLRIERGGGCTLANYERVMAWFANSANWPCGIPDRTRKLIMQKGFNQPSSGSAAAHD